MVSYYLLFFFEKVSIMPLISNYQLTGEQDLASGRALVGVVHWLNCCSCDCTIGIKRNVNFLISFFSIYEKGNGWKIYEFMWSKTVDILEVCHKELTSALSCSGLQMMLVKVLIFCSDQFEFCLRLVDNPTRQAEDLLIGFHSRVCGQFIVDEK